MYFLLTVFLNSGSRACMRSLFVLGSFRHLYMLYETMSASCIPEQWDDGMANTPFILLSSFTPYFV